MSDEKSLRAGILKVLELGATSRGTDTSNSIEEFAVERQAFEEAGALVPPYHPRTLTDIYENSSTLRQNVDAYATNIDGNGYHLEPIIDLDSDDAHDQVSNAIYLERLAARDAGQVIESLVPSEEEIAERTQKIADGMRLERFRIEQFFETCTVEESFIALRRKTREDLEVTGNAYWEVLRDGRERVSQFEYLPSHTMRLMKLERELVDVVVPVRTGPISLGNEKLRRRFRRFVQVVGSKKVYFKEYGDPRTMSALSGKYYESALEMEQAEKGLLRGETDKVPQATEVAHFRVHSPSSPYGVPRWMGALLAVMGTRNSEEVNYLYFENKTVPPMALIVSGASVSKDTVRRVESFLENNVKGKHNFHKLLVIEAESATATDPDGMPGGRIRIDLKPLTQAQQSDALFQRYDERNMDKVGMAFRMPRMLRGDIRDFNRATADAALEFAETQVFGPERQEFDHAMNKFVLSPMGFRFWRFASNSVQVRDPRVVAEMIERLARTNVLVPADGRQLAEELVFNRKLRNLDADWVYQPPMLTQVGVPLDTQEDGVIPGAGVVPAGPESEGGLGRVAPGRQQQISFGWHGRRRRRMSETELAHAARELIRLRDALVEEETKQARKELLDAKADEARQPVPVVETRKADEGAEVIRMPLDEMIEQFGLIRNG